MKTISFSKFIEVVDQTSNNFNWRKGQSLMNVLYDVWREKHDEIINSEKDCYYNDKIVTDTLLYLQQQWTLDNS